MLESMRGIRGSDEEIPTAVRRNHDEFGGLAAVIQPLAEKAMVINDIFFQIKIAEVNATVERTRTKAEALMDQDNRSVADGVQRAEASGQFMLRLAETSDEFTRRAR
jgi:hypothetical protein